MPIQRNRQMTVEKGMTLTLTVKEWELINEALSAEIMYSAPNYRDDQVKDMEFLSTVITQKLSQEKR